MKPNAVVEKITPALAAKILEGNTHNRKFSSAVSMRYAREMEEGRWMLNGEPIIIADDGSLLDGQHRLYAVLESDKAQEFFVVRGIEKAAFMTIDTGAMRKAKDVFSIEKIANPHIAGAICKVALQYNINPNLSSRRTTFSNQEVLDFYHQNKEAIDWATQISARMKLKQVIASTVSGFLCFIAYNLKDRVEQFFAALEAGTGLEANSPIFVLRERLLRDKDGSVIRAEMKTALVIKAWNAWITGKTMTKISFAQDKEGYPMPITGARQISKAIGKAS